MSAWHDQRLEVRERWEVVTRFITALVAGLFFFFSTFMGLYLGTWHAEIAAAKKPWPIRVGRVVKLEGPRQYGVLSSGRTAVIAIPDYYRHKTYVQETLLGFEQVGSKVVARTNAKGGFYVFNAANQGTYPWKIQQGFWPSVAIILLVVEGFLTVGAPIIGVEFTPAVWRLFHVRGRLGTA